MTTNLATLFQVSSPVLLSPADSHRWLDQNVMIDCNCFDHASEYLSPYGETAEWEREPLRIISHRKGAIHVYPCLGQIDLRRGDDPWPDTPTLALDVLLGKCEYTPHAAPSCVSAAAPPPIFHAILTVSRFALLSRFQYLSLSAFEQAHIYF